MFDYYEVRFKFTTVSLQSDCLQYYITVDMLFNIVGHKIDGNYEFWKYMWQNTTRDRLAPGRGAVFPTPCGKTVFFGAVQIMLIFFSHCIFS